MPSETHPSKSTRDVHEHQRGRDALLPDLASRIVCYENIRREKSVRDEPYTRCEAPEDRVAHRSLREPRSCFVGVINGAKVDEKERNDVDEAMDEGVDEERLVGRESGEEELDKDRGDCAANARARDSEACKVGNGGEHTASLRLGNMWRPARGETPFF